MTPDQRRQFAANASTGADLSPGDPVDAAALDHIFLLERARDTLFDAIVHGDAEHKAWLKTAIDAHFAGEPVPPVAGAGNKEARIATLEDALRRVRVEAERSSRQFVCMSETLIKKIIKEVLP